jgi:O-acetyl-ADP-ribose deacetylase (regulator of RNase III)
VEKKMANGVLRLVRDDLTLLELDAFVYYARHDLVLGSGWGAAISARGGMGIQEELNEKGSLETCDVIASSAGDLKADHIFHAVGPRFQEEDTEGKLRKTMQNTLSAAKEAGLSKIGFPTMGAGYYGIPLDLCAKVMISEIESHLNGDTSLTEVVICVQDRRELDVFEPMIAAKQTS